MLVDDLGWNDLACYGSTFHETPRLDAFARTAVKFEQAYAAGSVCSPTRAALMTGLYPPRLHITDWIAGRGDRNRLLETPRIELQLPLEQQSLAELFSSAGYQTCFAGKWHLGGKGYYPQDQGFALNFGGHEKGSPPGGYYAPYKNPQLEDGPQGEYLPDRLTDEAIHFIRENKDTPFLLYLSYYTVHTPIQACKRHLQKFQAKLEASAVADSDEQLFRPEHDGFSRTKQNNPAYASMVYAMDENIGRLLDTLTELGLDDETIVVFTSDNGGLSTLPRAGAPTSVLPLRAGKGWLYEGGIRVPLLIRHPEAVAGQSNQPVISMDLISTLADSCGLEFADGPRDGRSLMPLLRGQTQSIQRDMLCWHYPHYHGSAWRPGAAIRWKDWKLLEFYESSEVELYDLAADPGETEDLSQARPKIRDQLLDQLHSWQQDVGAQLPKRRD